MTKKLSLIHIYEVFNLLMIEGMEAEVGLPALFRNKENQEENYE